MAKNSIYFVPRKIDECVQHLLLYLFNVKMKGYSTVFIHINIYQVFNYFNEFSFKIA